MRVLLLFCIALASMCALDQAEVDRLVRERVEAREREEAQKNTVSNANGPRVYDPKAAKAARVEEGKRNQSVKAKAPQTVPAPAQPTAIELERRAMDEAMMQDIRRKNKEESERHAKALALKIEEDRQRELREQEQRKLDEIKDQEHRQRMETQARDEANAKASRAEFRRIVTGILWLLAFCFIGGMPILIAKARQSPIFSPCAGLILGILLLKLISLFFDQSGIFLSAQGCGYLAAMAMACWPHPQARTVH